MCGSRPPLISRRTGAPVRRQRRRAASVTAGGRMRQSSLEEISEVSLDVLSRVAQESADYPLQIRSPTSEFYIYVQYQIQGVDPPLLAGQRIEYPSCRTRRARRSVGDTLTGSLDEKSTRHAFIEFILRRTSLSGILVEHADRLRPLLHQVEFSPAVAKDAHRKWFSIPGHFGFSARRSCPAAGAAQRSLHAPSAYLIEPGLIAGRLRLIDLDPQASSLGKLEVRLRF